MLGMFDRTGSNGDCARPGRSASVEPRPRHWTQAKADYLAGEGESELTWGQLLTLARNMNRERVADLPRNGIVLHVILGSQSTFGKRLTER